MTLIQAVAWLHETFPDRDIPQADTLKRQAQLGVLKAVNTYDGERGLRLWKTTKADLTAYARDHMGRPGVKKTYCPWPVNLAG